MKILTLILMCTSLVCLSCKSTNVNKNNDRVVAGLDTIIVNANELGLSFSSAPLRTLPTQLLDYVGDEVTIKFGEAASIKVGDIAGRNSTIESVIDDEMGTITLRVVEAGSNKIVLTKKCQTVECVGIGSLPAIEVAPGLSPEQIVVTPMCNYQGVVAGYSIRYGSTTRGCRSEAQAALRAFARCGKTQTKKAPLPPKSIEPWQILFNGDR